MTAGGLLAPLFVVMDLFALRYWKRRTLRDGRDGNRFIINIPGRGYSFVASVAVAHWVEPDGDENRAPLRD